MTQTNMHAQQCTTAHLVMPITHETEQDVRKCHTPR